MAYSPLSINLYLLQNSYLKGLSAAGDTYLLRVWFLLSRSSQSPWIKKNNNNARLFWDSFKPSDNHDSIGDQKMSVNRKEFCWVLKDRSVLDRLKKKGAGITNGRTIVWPKVCRQGLREQKTESIVEEFKWEVTGDKTIEGLDTRLELGLYTVEILKISEGIKWWKLCLGKFI